MTQPSFVEADVRQFTAGAAIAQYLRVKLSAGKLAKAGSTDVELGTMTVASFADGDVVGVRLRTAEGTSLMVAAAAITAGNPCYAGANGKVDASGTILMGIALSAASADGDVLEVLRRQETSDSAAAGGTTAAAFLVDSDATIPKIELASQVGGTGDYKVTIKPASTLTANRVVTIPDAATQVMVGDTATQTLTNKTLTSPTITGATQTLNVESVGAAGNSQGTATAISIGSGGFVLGTGADGTKGIALPTAAAGKFFIIKNEDSANAILKVYPGTSDAINALSANAAISMAAKTSALFVAVDAVTWYTIPLLPS